MSLETRRPLLFDAQKTDKEPITVVYAHGFGVDGTDVRQQEIDRHIKIMNPSVGAIMPNLCDVVDDDILVKLPIEQQAERLAQTLEEIPGQKIVAAHSQGTVAAAEIVAHYGRELGVTDSVWMGPVIDTKKEAARLGQEAARWAASVEVIQHIQDTLPEEERFASKNIQHYIHYRPDDIKKPTTDVVVTEAYLRSLGEKASRHISNLRNIWTSPGATIITAGDEVVTDGTREVLDDTFPDVWLYSDLLDPRIFTLRGANHRFGGGYRKAIADIMHMRIAALRVPRAMATRALSDA